MSSKLEILLDKFEPQNSWDKVEREGNSILLNYKIENNTVRSSDEAINILADFTSKFYGPPGAYEKRFRSMFFDMAIQALKKVYPELTFSYIRDIMVSGREGGVYEILKKLTNLFCESQWETRIRIRIGDFNKDTTDKERELAAKEYVEKYNDFLSVNFKGDPLWVYINFDEVLFEHAITLRKLQGSYQS